MRYATRYRVGDWMNSLAGIPANPTNWKPKASCTSVSYNWLSLNEHDSTGVNENYIDHRFASREMIHYSASRIPSL